MILKTLKKQNKNKLNKINLFLLKDMFVCEYPEYETKYDFFKVIDREKIIEKMEEKLYESVSRNSFKNINFFDFNFNEKGYLIFYFKSSFLKNLFKIILNHGHIEQYLNFSKVLKNVVFKRFVENRNLAKQISNDFLLDCLITEEQKILEKNKKIVMDEFYKTNPSPSLKITNKYPFIY